MLKMTDHEFTTNHQILNQRIFDFAFTKRGRARVSQQLKNRLSMSAATSLKAINNHARIRFSAEFAARLDSFLSEQDIQDVYFVTLIERGHARRLEDAADFDIAQCKKSMAEAMRGFSFIGIVEPAYYYRTPFIPLGRRYVSWHSHALVWSISNSEVKSRIDEFNSKYEAFVPGYHAGHFRSLSRLQALSYCRYMSKNIVRECTAYPMKKEVADPETGELIPTLTGRWKHKKREIRSSSFILAASAVRDRTLDQLTFAGGTGKILRKTILCETVSALNKTTSVRNRIIDSLLFGA